MPFSSPHIILASSLQYGFEHASLPGKVIGGLLVALSCWSWTAMVAKLFFLRRSRAANRAFGELYYGSAHPLGPFQSGEHFDRSPCYHIYHTAAQELAFQLVGVDQPDKTFAARLQGAGRITASQMAAVRHCIERAVSEAALKLEERLGVVLIALSAAPFLGLLGTVWGILDTFARLAESPEPATLQALAPGICAALLTSLVGLLVAIPSIFGYNLLVGRIRAAVARLDNFASELGTSPDRHYVDHRSPADELPSLGSLGSPTLPAFSGGAPQSRSQPGVGALSVTQAPGASIL